MASNFLSGALSGFSSTAMQRKKSGQRGLLRGEPKTTRRITGKAREYDPSTGGAGPAEPLPSYKRGGKVRKTGLARVHRGERVLTKKQAKRYRRGRGKSR